MIKNHPKQRIKLLLNICLAIVTAQIIKLQTDKVSFIKTNFISFHRLKDEIIQIQNKRYKKKKRAVLYVSCKDKRRKITVYL